MNKMNFTEKALKAYQNKKIKDDLKEQKEIDVFCGKALKALKEQFDLEDNFDQNINIIDKKSGSLKVILEDITISIQFSRGYYTFEMIKKCPRCGVEYTKDVKSLENIGEFLMEEHNKFDCDQVINRTKHIETTEERFINALRDLISEIGQG